MGVKYTGHCPKCLKGDRLRVIDVPINLRDVWVNETTGDVEWGDVYGMECREELRDFINSALESGQYFCDNCGAEFGEEDILIHTEEIPEPASTVERGPGDIRTAILNALGRLLPDEGERAEAIAFLENEGIL